MDSNTAGNVKYDRWNETVNMNEEASQSTTMRIYNRVCRPIVSSGIAVKAAGALSVVVSMYILGYVTGYYIHKC
ncbi:small integral membrane protein 1 [Scomber scombrus]|uniref:Small integral membrane protein 1 n=1 Tax=Scomber scombrus TaxID=13677 RepID=A0AAV1N7H8_SCOSC|nr:small integral membrane protein 1 [Scomber scombrus]